MGIRDVTFALDMDTRANLKRLCKERGLTKTQLLTQLINGESACSSTTSDSGAT